MSSTSDHDRISAIYYEASQRTAAERADFLDAACAGDPDLREAVLALLASERRLPDLLKTGALSGRIREEIEQRPARVGPFEIADKLGEGGMGVVYRGLQREPIRREVAIKLIRGGFESDRVLARFEAERQALALMSHPGIAHVLDAGVTAAGHPYIAMEYVEGEPITVHSDRLRLTLDERLALFLEVCEAVQHAHQKAIIHRDLKPSNILVTTRSGRPLPKIIDFGVARALEERPSDPALRTEAGQLIGTPEYMSPEQAALDDGGIDTRTDIYSLGVLLYELLTGIQPFGSEELRRGGLDEARRVIRECDPPRPSARVEALRDEAIAHARGLDVRSLARRLRGDLDWITLRALEKEPARRYASASELAADVARTLANEPVLASPPSRSYRTRKFVRRHRIGVGFAATLALLLAGVAVATSLQAQRTASERDRALRKAAGAAQVSEFLVSIFDLAEDREAARRQLDLAREQVEHVYGGDAAERARLLYPLSQIYDSLGFPEGGHLMEEILDVMRAAMGPDDPEVLALMVIRGQQLSAALRHEEAVAMMTEVVDRRRRVLGPDHRETIEGLTWLARFLERAGRLDEAERQLADARTRAEAHLGADDPIALRLIAVAGVLELRQGRLAEAERHLRDVAPRLERVLGPRHTNTLSTLYKLGCIQALRGNDAEALALIGRAVHGGWTWGWSESDQVPTHVGLRESPELAGLRGNPEFEALVGPDGYLAAIEGARAAARSRNIPEALRLLRTAIERGYDDPDVIIVDMQLSPLLGQSEFQQMVAELRSRNE